MSTRGGLAREMRVALSRRAQPVWFRMLKWVVLIAISALLWRTAYFWWWLGDPLALGVAVHLVWRWKTRAWTQPWGGWDDVEAANGGTPSD